jgi:hypothetical protein
MGDGDSRHDGDRSGDRGDAQETEHSEAVCVFHWSVAVENEIGSG